MKLSMAAVLPRRLTIRKDRLVSVGPSSQLLEAATSEVDALLDHLGTSRSGLTSEEAERRLEKFGPNTVASEDGPTRLRVLLKALLNPLVVLLAVLGTISALTGDVRAAIVMGVMVVLGVALRFVQEVRADTAAAKLRAMIRVTATALRESTAREVPLAELVPGDVVKLSAGDMIPADVRVIVSKDLFVVQASLTGESMPVEKTDRRNLREPVRRSSSGISAFSERASRAGLPRPSSWQRVRAPTSGPSLEESSVSRSRPPSTRASAVSPG